MTPFSVRQASINAGGQGAPPLMKKWTWLKSASA
jgi:hypothetical protein